MTFGMSQKPLIESMKELNKKVNLSETLNFNDQFNPWALGVPAFKPEAVCSFGKCLLEDVPVGGIASLETLTLIK